MQVRLLVRTLNNYRPVQLWHRAVKMVVAKIGFGSTPVQVGPVFFRVSHFNPIKMNFRQACEGASDVSRVIELADAYVQGEVKLAGRLVRRTVTGKWVHEEVDLLCDYTVQYCEWGIVLAQAFELTRSDCYREAFWTYCQEWLDQNPATSVPGWDPYPISRRLINLLQGFAVFGQEPKDEEQAESLLSSLALQAEVLARRLEKDLANNHLFANFSSLAFVRALLDYKSHLVQQSLTGCFAQVWSELEEQVWSDGVHFEHSTSYHMAILKDVLEVIVLAQRIGCEVPESVLTKIHLMFDFLQAVVRPDGSVPLLGDSVPGYPISAKDLFCLGAVLLGRGDLRFAAGSFSLYAAWWLGTEGQARFDTLPQVPPSWSSRSFDSSGYSVLRSGWGRDDSVLVFDAGAISGRHVAGHAHADSLSLDLFALGAPRIIDPGVCTYDAGDIRQYFRGTAAHNTVVVDGDNSTEVWGAFRTGMHARARLHAITFTCDGGEVVGHLLRYAHKDGLSHSRTVQAERNRWRVDDILTSASEHLFEVMFHLPFASRVDISGNRATVSYADGIEMQVLFNGPVGMHVDVRSGYVSCAWRELLEAPVLVASAKGQGAMHFSTLLHLLNK